MLGYVVGRDTAPATVPAERGRPGEIPAGWTFTDDPTWDFYTASVAPGLDGTQPPDSFTDSLLAASLDPAGLAGSRRADPVRAWSCSALLVVAPFLAWPFLDPRRRRFLLGWAAFAVVLVVGSLILFELSHTYVPQRTAGRRLMPYLLIAPGRRDDGVAVADRAAHGARLARVAAGHAAAVVRSPARSRWSS